MFHTLEMTQGLNVCREGLKQVEVSSTGVGGGEGNLISRFEVDLKLMHLAPVSDHPPSPKMCLQFDTALSCKRACCALIGMGNTLLGGEGS